MYGSLMFLWPIISRRPASRAHKMSNNLIMEPPTMLLVPICRDMQLWWDKPPIPSPRRNCMPTETCFDDVGRICACVTWTQMYVTLQTKNIFHSNAVIILFFNQPLIFFRYSFQYRRNSNMIMTVLPLKRTPLIFFFFFFFFWGGGGRTVKLK